MENGDDTGSARDNGPDTAQRTIATNWRNDTHRGNRLALRSEAVPEMECAARVDTAPWIVLWETAAPRRRAPAGSLLAQRRQATAAADYFGFADSKASNRALA